MHRARPLVEAPGLGDVLRVVAHAPLASELESESIRIKNLDGGYTSKQMDSPIHVPLLERAQKETAVADQTLARKLLLGLPIAGEADCSCTLVGAAYPLRSLLRSC